MNRITKSYTVRVYYLVNPFKVLPVRTIKKLFYAELFDEEIINED